MRLTPIILTMAIATLASPVPDPNKADDEIAAISNCIWQKNAVSYSFAMRYFNPSKATGDGFDSASPCGSALKGALDHLRAGATEFQCHYSKDGNSACVTFNTPTLAKPLDKYIYPAYSKATGKKLLCRDAPIEAVCPKEYNE